MFRLKVFFKNSSISNFLISSLFLIFIITIGHAYLTVKFLNDYLQNNTIIVNKLGLIRGNIQRYVKLKIANSYYKDLESEIDETFKETCEMIKQKTFLEKDQYFLKSHKKAHDLWEKIKASNKDLIHLSELEWKTTNHMTLYIQNVLNKKFIELKYIYILVMLLTSIFILVLIGIVYYLIKKGLEIDNITDGLTKLFNRAYFNEQIVYHIEKFNKNKEPFTLLLFDIDNFKKINDTYGHDKGDEILINVAKTLKESIRKTDLAFRYGGEEFTVIFPNTALQDAKIVLDRFLNNLKNIKIEENPITVSGGMKEYQGEGMLDFIKDIDEALYEVKKSGKNRIKILY